eukprot:NODE_28005_length_492_cov_3.369863.p4 GENE.NODE_28005_length_492_cov_3.369863~~NODE_28005_length_492_cov_3.369863.p4  ORF type:complete len:70 (-),score=27.50 NODE_28005_length_492_cov_3.369863:16-225(-)
MPRHNSLSDYSVFGRGAPGSSVANGARAPFHIFGKASLRLCFTVCLHKKKKKKKKKKKIQKKTNPHKTK